MAASTAERAALLNKTTILVADDDPDVMAVIVETLEPEGYRVLTACDGDAALQIARDERPDLVVLDWMMPQRDGLSVCRALRQEPDPKLAAVPVVLITGRADAQDTVAGFKAGVTDYLTKPFKPSHLVARLQSWLIRSQGA
jgi:DNA-binding response OmpR family regulator